jgi:hypothetical protein
MAYQPCCCSVTLLCPVCISVFCTPLALFVLLSFMLSAHSPSMHHSSIMHFYSCALPPCTHLNPSTTTTTLSSFHILLLPVLRVHAIFAMPLHAHTVSNLLHISSAFPDHRNSSASLVVPATRSASLGVLLRFLNLFGN